MDNDILVGNDLLEFQHMKDIHPKSSGIKDIGGLKFISGSEAAQSNKGIPFVKGNISLTN